MDIQTYLNQNTDLRRAFVNGEALCLTGYGKFIFLNNLKKVLTPEETLAFCKDYLDGYGCRRNLALERLQGKVCKISSSKRAWNISFGYGEPLVVHRGTTGWSTIPSISTTNGAGHWISYHTKSLAKEVLASGRVGVDYKIKVLQKTVSS